MRFPKGHYVKLFHNNHLPMVGSIKPAIGRNKLCVCGSGKKFKNCCMERQIVNSQTGESFVIKSSK